jgi:hypothetical protein
MKSLRKFAYAVVLILSALSFEPSPAAAQDAAGTFTLAHEVHWQNAIVPPGKYRFTIGSSGPAEMLTLRNLTGSASFMILVVDTEESLPSDSSQLVLVPRSAGSFVSTMRLPEFGLTLNFTVPAETREVAQNATAKMIGTR